MRTLAIVLTLFSTTSSLSLASLPRADLVRKPHAAIARSSNVAAFLDADTTKRIQVAGIAILTSLALVASPLPAHAKGGGHGGGGGGGHSSSHSSSHSSRPSYPRSATLSSHRLSSAPSSSSSRRSSRRSGDSFSYSSSSYERDLRIFPTSDEAREEGGLYCPATLPSVGSKVYVEGASATVLQSQPALQSGLYDGGVGGSSQPLPPGFDAGCTLQVQYADGSSDTVLAAQEPPSALDTFVSYAIWPAYFGAIHWAENYSSRHEEYEEKYDKFLEDAAAAAKGRGLGETDLVPRASAMSGEYWGASAESDEGDQAVRMHLKFGSGGRLTGRGRDGADGSYKLTSGRWMADDDGKVQLGWREKYAEGFEAICFGEYDVETGKIRGQFASSRGVSGSFEIAKKPSVF